MSDTPRELAEWLEGRPDEIRRLAAEFPLESPVATADGPTGYVVGWAEGDGVVVSPIHPAADWDGSMAARRRVPAAAFRRD